MKLEQLGGIVVSFVLLLVGSTAAQVRSAGARSAIHNTIEESNNEQQQQIRQQQLRATAAASSNTNSQPSTTPVDNSGAPPLAAITTTTKATTTRTTEETRRLQPQTLTPWERETNSRKERYTWTKVRSPGARQAAWTEWVDSCLERHTSKECVVVGDSMTCPIGSTLNFFGWFNAEKRHIIADLACPLDAIAQSSFAEVASEEDGPCVCSVKQANPICELIDYYDDWGCRCRKCPPGSLLDYAYECTIRLTQGCRALDCNAECTDVVPPEELGIESSIWVPAEIPTPAPMPPTPRPTRPPYFWDIPQRTEAPEIEGTTPTESPETGSPTSSRSAPSTSEPNPEQEQNPTPCPATLGIGNLRCIGSSIERGRTVSRGNSILV